MLLHSILLVIALRSGLAHPALHGQADIGFKYLQNQLSDFGEKN